jgi:hypothetical protein
LVNTPKSTVADNLFDTYAHITINPDGTAKAQLKFLSTGEYRAMYVALEGEKTDLQKEYLLRSLNIKQPIAFDFQPSADKNGTKEVNIALLYDKFYDMNVGDKKFFKPAVLDIWHGTLPEVAKRSTDFYFEHPMKKSCVTTIDLPEGYEMEAMPADVKLKFSYGNYDVNYQYDKAKNQVTAKAVFELDNQVIPAAKYNELQQYMEDIAKSQSKKLVIKRKV